MPSKGRENRGNIVRPSPQGDKIKKDGRDKGDRQDNALLFPEENEKRPRTERCTSPRFIYKGGLRYREQ